VGRPRLQERHRSPSRPLRGRNKPNTITLVALLHFNGHSKLPRKANGTFLSRPRRRSSFGYNPLFRLSRDQDIRSTTQISANRGCSPTETTKALQKSAASSQQHNATLFPSTYQYWNNKGQSPITTIHTLRCFRYLTASHSTSGTSPSPLLGGRFHPTALGTVSTQTQFLDILAVERCVSNYRGGKHPPLVNSSTKGKTSTAATAAYPAAITNRSPP
jgi:hypothetical protein